MKTITSIVVLIFLCCNCSNREAKEKALKDLESYQTKFADFTAMLEGSKNRLKVLEQDLIVARDRLNQVTGFQLLRTADEREKQLREATAAIQDIEQKMQDAQKMIMSMSDSVSNTEVRISVTKEKLKD